MWRLSKFIVLALGVLLASCQSSAGPMPAVQEAGLATTAPEAAGLSSERLERINKVVQGYVAEKKAVGFVTMIARRGNVAHFESFGLMDMKPGKATKPDAIFRIYSMSKPITSAAVMMLYEEGHFQLDDPVSKFIPEFKDMKVFVKKTEAGVELTDAKRQITIRNLLTHTSGLAYGLDKDTEVDVMYQEQKLLKWDETLQEKVARLVKLPLVEEPGSKWRYSISTDVLGYLVEVISGKRLDVFLQERLFEPLGMKDTGFYVPGEKLSRLAGFYEIKETGGLGPVADEDYWGMYSKLPEFLSGGGGLVSTTSDYVRFCQMMLNGGELDGVRLLGRKTVELMTMNHLDFKLLSSGPGEGSGFGLGFAVLMDVAKSGSIGSAGSYSWGGAASTGFWIDPREELIGIVMTQIIPYTNRFTEEFKVLTYQAIVD